jgi:hypothetical protein
MVELRWRNIYSKVVFQGKKTLLKTVLEYRQFADGIWTKWNLVPTVEEEDES